MSVPPAQTQALTTRPPAPVARRAPANVQQPAPPAAPVTAQKPQPEPDPVADIIAQAEKEYQAGRDNYKAGHLEAAKQNFDRAFNLLLGSTLDVYSDERLQQELDRVLEGVNSEDMQALQEGDGDRKSTRLNSSHLVISYAVFCLKKKNFALWRLTAH